MACIDFHKGGWGIPDEKAIERGWGADMGFGGMGWGFALGTTCVWFALILLINPF